MIKAREKQNGPEKNKKGPKKIPEKSAADVVFMMLRDEVSNSLTILYRKQIRRRFSPDFSQGLFCFSQGHFAFLWLFSDLF